MPQVSAVHDEIEFEDRFGDKRVIHRKSGGGLAVKRTRVTPALALNQEVARLIGARIRDIRIARGLSLADLCERAGIVSATPKSRMWEIENSIRGQGLRLGTLYAIAMALDVEVFAIMPPTPEVEAIARPVRKVRTAVALANGGRA